LQEQQEAELEFLGCFKTVIVGIRYYTGRVGLNEVNLGLVHSTHYMCTKLGLHSDTRFLRAHQHMLQQYCCSMFGQQQRQQQHQQRQKQQQLLPR
jgi:hypothetical protein